MEKSLDICTAIVTEEGKRSIKSCQCLQLRRHFGISDRKGNDLAIISKS